MPPLACIHHLRPPTNGEPLSDSVVPCPTFGGVSPPGNQWLSQDKLKHITTRATSSEHFPLITPGPPIQTHRALRISRCVRRPRTPAARPEGVRGTRSARPAVGGPVPALGWATRV